MKDLWLKSKEKAVSDEQTAVSSNDPANSAAEQYGFTPEQDRQPAKLLKLENQSLWSAALYGIGNNSGDLVTLALSQVGNARDYLLPCLTVPTQNEAHRRMGAKTFAVSERVPQSRLHNPTHKRQAERLPCQHRRAVTGEHGKAYGADEIGAGYPQSS